MDILVGIKKHSFVFFVVVEKTRLSEMNVACSKSHTFWGEMLRITSEYEKTGVNVERILYEIDEDGKKPRPTHITAKYNIVWV